MLVVCSYTLNTSTDDARVTYRNVTVLRRFSDFAWLQEELSRHADLRGVVTPPLPPKQLLGRFEPAFVHARRRGLRRFLCKPIRNNN